MEKKNNKKYKLLLQVLAMVVAALLYALTTNYLIKPGGILPSGITGVSLLIQKVFLDFFDINIPFALINLTLNIIPIYIGFKYIGKKFTFLSLIMIFLSSIFVDIIPLQSPFTDETLLFSVFGGIALGITISICLRAGATSGGTDFISIYLLERKNIDAWNLILFFNCIVLLIAGLLFNFEISLFSIIAQFVCTQTIKTLFTRYNKSTMMIFTSKKEEVYELIKKITNHDATLIKGSGMYRGKDVDILYSVVSYDETRKLSNEIMKTDKDAFINVIKGSEVNGRFYLEPKE